MVQVQWRREYGNNTSEDKYIYINAEGREEDEKNEVSRVRRVIRREKENRKIDLCGYGQKPNRHNIQHANIHIYIYLCINADIELIAREPVYNNNNKTSVRRAF